MLASLPSFEDHGPIRAKGSRSFISWLLPRQEHNLSTLDSFSESYSINAPAIIGNKQLCCSNQFHPYVDENTEIGSSDNH